MTLSADTMTVLEPGLVARMSTTDGAGVMLLSGAYLSGDLFIDWNFVSSSRKGIESEKAAWLDQKLGKVPGETEWPL